MSAVTGKNLLILWLAALSAGLIFMAWGRAAPKVTDFEEINVQRINIVEPDGKPRVVIASKARAAGLYWGGREFKHPSRNDGGFWFMNDDGDEVGGMTFSSRQEGDSYSARAGLTFDQYKQDQTISLLYGEQNGERTAGLRVWDRPSESLGPVVQLSDKLARATSDEERREIRAEIGEIAKSWGPHPVPERFFAGKQLGESLVKLADKQGRVRLLLKVSESGQPSIEFMDEAGKVVRRIE